MKHSTVELREMQGLPLNIKTRMTKRRIRDWYDYFGGQVYVSFSGGKDSTVLLHLAREVYPDIEAVFVNTGLEYPEIQKFVKTFDNVAILRPKMRFDEVIKKYGYPIISKEVSLNIEYAKRGSEWAKLKLQGKDKHGNESERRKSFVKYAPLINCDFNISSFCCSVMKKTPVKEFEKRTDKKPITAMLATESSMRENGWLKNGCNAFETKRPISNPMSFWTEQDVLQYIKESNIPLASIYGDVVYKDEYGLTYEDSICGGKLCTTGCDRTGCIFCAFGAHLDERGGGRSRFERLKETHPKQYAYCIGGGEYVNGVWQPSKEGLGMGHVFDELNKIYGDGFIKY